jgi:hypothetical protein
VVSDSRQQPRKWCATRGSARGVQDARGGVAAGTAVGGKGTSLIERPLAGRDMRIHV